MSCQTAFGDRAAGNLNAIADTMCCKGIFAKKVYDLDSTQVNLDARPVKENNNTEGQFGYLGDFMQLGCMCIDDIYDQDTVFFDAIVDFVGGVDNPCADQTGESSADASVLKIKSDQDNHVAANSGVRSGITGSCPSPLPHNGFVKSVAPPAPPALPDAVATSEIVFDLHLRNFNADLMKEDVKREDFVQAALATFLKGQIATKTSALGGSFTAVSTSDIKVAVKYFSRGGKMLESRRRLQQSENEDTIVTLSITANPSSVDLTAAQVESVRQVLLDWRKEGASRVYFGSTYGNATISAATILNNGATPTSGMVPEIPDPSPSNKLPPAATGLPRQELDGSTYSGGFQLLESKKCKCSCCQGSGCTPVEVGRYTKERSYMVCKAEECAAEFSHICEVQPECHARGGCKNIAEPITTVTTKYNSSLLGQAVPGFAMAIILIVVMLLMLVVYVASTICGAMCCKCCNGAYKPRKFTKKDLVINKVMILVFVAMTAAGCFMIFSEAPKLLDSVSDLTQAMVDTVLDLVDDGSSISAALRAASVDDSMGLASMDVTLDSMDDAMDTVEDVINKAQDQIDEQLEAAGGLILAGAGGLFAVTFLVFAAAFIGWWRILILFIVILSLGMVLAWIVWGVISMLTVLLDDLCWAMQDYLDNPGSSDLGDLIPCMDPAAAVGIMTMARSMSVSGIVGVNAFLEDYAGENPYQQYICYQYAKVRLDELCDEENYYFDDDVTKYMCKAKKFGQLSTLEADPVDGHTYVYADAKCPFPTSFYKVALGNFGNEHDDPDKPGVNNLKCPFKGFKTDATTGEDVPIPFAIRQCYASRKIPADVFEKSESSATLAQGILDVVPVIEDLLQCAFVNNAFSSMVGPCDDMATALTNLYAGFLLVALGYFLTWVSTLVVVSRLQYYKVGCTDAGDRYKN